MEFARILFRSKTKLFLHTLQFEVNTYMYRVAVFLPYGKPLIWRSKSDTAFESMLNLQRCLIIC